MRKILFSIFSIALVAGLLQFVSFTNPTPAFAGTSGNYDTIGVTVEVVPRDAGAGINDNDTRPGAGGTVSPPETRNLYLTYTGCQYNDVSTMLTYPGDGFRTICPVPHHAWYANWPRLSAISCPVGANGTTALRMKWVRDQDTNDLVSYSCEYPPAPVTPTFNETWYCATGWNSVLHQASTKAEIANGGSVAGGVSNPNPKSGSFGGGDGNCPNGGVRVYSGIPATDSYNINSPETGGYGYYRMDLVAHTVECGRWGYPDWFGDNSLDEIRCTGYSRDFSGRNYAVSSCSHDYTTYGNNWNALPDNENFALDACVSFTCTPNGSFQINDTSTPVQVMRNGEPLKITYPTIGITTSGEMRPNGPTWDIQGGTGVVNGSTPFNAAVSANDTGQQYFKLFDYIPSSSIRHFLTSKQGPYSAWTKEKDINGNANPNFTNGYISFNWASNTGAPFKAYRTWKIANAQFFIYTPGSSSGGNGSKTWQSQDVYCGYVESNPVTVVRSANE